MWECCKSTRRRKGNVSLLWRSDDTRRKKIYKKYVKMTKKSETYKCEICGNVVKVVEEGTGELVCCGQPMKLIEKE